MDDNWRWGIDNWRWGVGKGVGECAAQKSLFMAVDKRFVLRRNVLMVGLDDCRRFLLLDLK